MDTRRQRYQSRLSLGEFNQKYGDLAFGEFEDVLKVLDKAGVVLTRPDPESIALITGEEFAKKIEDLRVKVFGGDGKDGMVAKSHQQDFNRFMGQALADVYGRDSGQVKNARVILYHAASEATKFVKMILSGLEWLDKKRELPPNRAEDVLPLVAEAERLFRAKRAEFEAEMKKVTLDPKDFAGNTKKYITAKTEQQRPFQEQIEKIGKLLGACSWLKKAFAESKPLDATEPPKDKKTELKERISELEEQMSGLRGRITPTTPVSDLIQATSRMREIESELAAAKAELGKLEAPEKEMSRVTAHAVVVAIAPPKPGESTGTMPGAVHTAPAQIENTKPETLEEVVTKIAALEKEFADAMSAADRHYADATALYAEAEKLRAEGKRGAAGKKDVDGGEFEAKSSKARKAAEQIQTRLLAFRAMKAELEKAAPPPAVATPPAGEKKKVRLAGRKPAAEPVVAAAGAVAQDGNAGRVETLTTAEDPKAMITREIARHAKEGNTAMVAALTETLKVLG